MKPYQLGAKAGISLEWTEETIIIRALFGIRCCEESLRTKFASMYFIKDPSLMICKLDLSDSKCLSSDLQQGIWKLNLGLWILGIQNRSSLQSLIDHLTLMLFDNILHNPCCLGLSYFPKGIQYNFSSHSTQKEPPASQSPM